MKTRKLINAIVLLLIVSSYRCTPPTYINIAKANQIEINIRSFQKNWNKSISLNISLEKLVNCFQKMQTVMPLEKRYSYSYQGSVKFNFTDLYLSDKNLYEICRLMQKPLANLKANEEIIYRYGNFIGSILAMYNKDLTGSKIHDDPNEIIILISHMGGYTGTLMERKGLKTATGTSGTSFLYCFFDSQSNLLHWRTTGSGWNFE